MVFHHRSDHLADRASQQMRRALGHASEGVRDLAGEGSDYLGRAVAGGRALARNVEEQPLPAIVGVGVLAFVLGWLLRSWSTGAPPPPSPPRRRRPVSRPAASRRPVRSAAGRKG